MIRWVFFFAIISLLLPLLAAGLKPLTKGWYGGCSLCHFLCNWTLDYGMMRRLFLFVLFPFLLSVAAAGLEPLTMGWWGECSSLPLFLSCCQQRQLDSNPWPLYDEVSVLLCHYFFPAASSGRWTQTLDHCMIRWEFFFHQILSPVASNGSWTWTLDLGMIGECRLSWDTFSLAKKSSCYAVKILYRKKLDV